VLAAAQSIRDIPRMIEKLLLGCCGSVGIFGIPNLIVHLRMVHGTEIQTLMTASAQKFITRYALESLTGNPVQTAMFEGPARNHISYVTSHPVFLIAPATANIISKIASGIADDIVSLCASVCLGSPTQLVIAPAMNPAMWSSMILQGNVNRLKDAGVHFIGPSAGIEVLTLQETPVGGMASSVQIVERLLELANGGSAGP
jgi:phosphopantothenoylcysteine synthetase/decarboxylase